MIKGVKLHEKYKIWSMFIDLLVHILYKSFRVSDNDKKGTYLIITICNRDV